MTICEWLHESILVGGTGYKLLEIATLGEHTKSRTINAVVKMAPVLAELSALQQRLTVMKSKVPGIDYTTVNISEISSSGPPFT
jgi:hypothetical protein